MHLYWRVFEELKWLGEFAFFHDPSLNRSFTNWLKTHEQAITLAELRGVSMFPGPEAFGVEPSLN